MNFEKYIGIPYVEKGRDITGLDCYGLVRLIYKNELDINLPSFVTEYDPSDNQRLEDLFAQYKEGWESVDNPKVGDVVIFRIFGYESHIGICIGDNKFLHVREGKDSVIESLDNAKWSKRITGFFKYSEQKNAILNTIPHPLKTERYTLAIVPGTTVAEIVKDISEKYNVAVELKSRISVLINGRVIAQEKWSDTVVNQSDVIEYRAVPGKDALRTLALIAVVYFAPMLAGAAEFAYMGTAAATAAGSAAVYTAAYAATVLVGSALINAIAPIRPPVQGASNDPGSAERQLMVNGGSNRGNPYGSIPVVLGKVRMTPLLGSNNFLTYENERDSYLSMLLVWGYGPLNIDDTSYKIGDVPLISFTDYNKITLDRKSEPTAEVKRNFDAIYGKDVTQVNTLVELVCDGNPETSTNINYSGSETSGYYTETGEYFSYFDIRFTGVTSGRNIEAYFTSSNTSSWSLSYTNLSNVVVTDISSTQKKITATTIADDRNFFPTKITYVLSPLATGTYTATVLSNVSPGPWFEAATNEVVNSVTLALHFPQGLRRIAVQGESAGNSYPVSVSFRAEYSIDNGSTWSLLESFSIGGDAVKKDAFTNTKTYNGLNYSQMIVRVRRETGDNTEDNPTYRYYFTSNLQNVTFLRNTNPAVDPVDTKIAKTAFKIKATDQLNGNIQGISAVVQTYCKVWNGTNWVDGVTSNPAALMRYVLEHPANPRKITNASSQINLNQLQYFYEYCTTRGFEYNGTLGEARSVLEVIRDICAAGRASPALVDGKWTVVIDEVKTNIVQHFTPHNSWGFEGAKSLPKRPDGLRVTYYDQDQDYQEAEIIVYDIGKDSSNANLFESITLPGVTKKSLVIDHAKWHMAQMKLRPEVYTLNSDIEYLVCNRGDRVKVMHDVPMWGLGSGRIKNRISNTQLELDEDVPMKAGLQYTIRFRSKSGVSVTRDVVPKTTDDYYSEIELVSSVTTDEADALDLFLFGEISQESQDLIVLGIEPTANNSARITLVDYGVTPQYNIFTDYLNLSASTLFESQLTLPPVLQVQAFGNKVPTITGFLSDESVMERVSKGIFKYNISVAYFNNSQLPPVVESVEVQYDLSSSESGVNLRSIFVPYQKGSATISDVKEGETYKVRMRYIARDGKVGNWSEYGNHTVVGKTNPPSQVTEFNVSADKSSGQLLLSWHPNLELDTSTYEVRTEDTGWGIGDVNRVFYGDNTNAFVKYVTNGSATFYIRAVDSSGNYSLTSSVVTFIPSAVPNISDIVYSYADTALTSATITLNWTDITDSEFDVAFYELTYNDDIRTVRANNITLPADWLGDRTFIVKTVDVHGNKSSGYSETIAKIAPNPPTDVRAQVVDNTVMLYWTLPVRTSLPIDHILIKKGATWDTATVLGDKKGEFTTINESIGGNFTYWLSAVDTESVQSTPVSITTLVSEPPDFVFHAEFDSTFTGTKSSATFDGSVLALPINTTETFDEHFTTRSWSTPEDQINAGYPVFIQPSVSTGYYEEIFDFGQPLASSRVLLTYNGNAVAGSPIVVPRISLSLDNSTYIDYNGVTDVFGLNFRYVKIRLTVTSVPTNIGLYEITQINVRLDAKLKNDAGTVSAVSADSLGTIINFNKEFIDIQSITLSPLATTPVISVYDIKDAFVSGTYSITSGVCTVSIDNHGMITGQNIKLFINSGSGNTGIYTITSYSTNSFTVNMSVDDTTGGCSMYPQSFRVYLFNNSGSRVSANTSWSIKGY